MPAKVEICNLSLTHLGIGKTIENFDTEKSEEARAFRAVYDIALRKTLRDYNWGFATMITDLALVEEDPNSEWGYSYRYPVDCINMKRILSGKRTDSRKSRVSYKIISDSQGVLVLTDQENAAMEYIFFADNPFTYPPDFVIAFSYYLAHLASARITLGDQFKLGDRAYKLYLVELSTAASRNFNEQQPDIEPDSEFITERL